MEKPEEFFSIKDNAEKWPSTNVKDRPSITYTCKLCGEKITIPYDALMRPSAIERHVNGHVLRFKGEID